MTGDQLLSTFPGNPSWLLKDQNIITPCCAPGRQSGGDSQTQDKARKANKLKAADSKKR